MPKSSPIQASFNAGEWSPLLDGRIDLAKYFNACARLENFIPLVQGGVRRRSGFRYVAAAKNSLRRTRLVAFEFSVEQAYIIEFGHLYCRFYRDHGRIESGGAPVEIATPYAEQDLFALFFAQSADVLYIVHPDYAPRTLSRSDHTSWSLAAIAFSDGPYLPVNSDPANTLTPSGTSGAITLTAANASFAATDAGRLVRFKDSGGDWSWLEITGFNSATQVSATVKGADLASAAASADWRLGLWSATTKYPACVTFFEDRWCAAGPRDHPQRLDGSRSGDYANFAPSDPDGTVADDHALAFTLNANNVNAIRWLMDDEKGLLAGTVGGEWVIRPSSLGEALTPSNVSAKRSTTFGAARVQPVRAGNAVLFVQRAGRKLRELAYAFEADGFRSPDLTLLAEHVTRSGLVELALGREPQAVVWAVRGDGQLLGMTYERGEDVIGWHRHPLGGGGLVESVATIPAPDGTRDELWAVVKRSVAGQTTRSLEYLEADFEAGDDPAMAFFVDSGLSYAGVPVSKVSGLDHLEGETVALLADGAVLAPQEVSGGAVTLQTAAAKVHAGLPYSSTLETLSLEAGAADGTAQGKTKRITQVTARFLATLGGFLGPEEGRLDEIPFRSAADALDAPPPLFDGDKTLLWPAGAERAGRMTLQQRQPLPMTLLALMPQVVTQDR